VELTGSEAEKQVMGGRKRPSPRSGQRPRVLPLPVDTRVRLPAAAWVRHQQTIAHVARSCRLRPPL